MGTKPIALVEPALMSRVKHTKPNVNRPAFLFSTRKKKILMATIHIDVYTDVA